MCYFPCKNTIFKGVFIFSKDYMQIQNANYNHEFVISLFHIHKSAIIYHHVFLLCLLCWIDLLHLYRAMPQIHHASTMTVKFLRKIVIKSHLKGIIKLLVTSSQDWREKSKVTILLWIVDPIHLLHLPVPTEFPQIFQIMHLSIKPCATCLTTVLIFRLGL